MTAVKGLKGHSHTNNDFLFTVREKTQSPHEAEVVVVDVKQVVSISSWMFNVNHVIIVTMATETAYFC